MFEINKKEIKMNKKLVIWGTGKRARILFSFYYKMNVKNKMQIIGFVDNDLKKWGKKFQDLPIYSPQDLKQLRFDYISIWISDDIIWRSIYFQLVEEIKVFEYQIIDAFELYKKELSSKYMNGNENIKLFIDKVNHKRDIDIYYFDVAKQYDLQEVFYDKEARLNYTLFEGKRLYLSRTFENYIMKNGKCYVGDCYWEQDANSPHVYESDKIFVKENSIVVDAGACEGNFSLHNIEKISKLYLIECDKNWIEALYYTFKPYKNKVVICDKFLSNYDSDTTMKLDSLIKENVNFLKMDIEGAEAEALKGAINLLNNSNEIACSICTYHKHDDEVNIRKILTDMKFEIEVSNGYMLFLHDKYVLQNPELRHGVIRGYKLDENCFRK